MATLPQDVKMVEAGDFIDQLALWLHQYNFLPIAKLHDFARSLFECNKGAGIGSRCAFSHASCCCCCCCWLLLLLLLLLAAAIDARPLRQLARVRL